MSFCVYGWTAGHYNISAAKRADCISQAIREEMHTRPGMPAVICGDFNGDTNEFPHLDAMFQSGSWTDAGAVAYRWGQPAAARPTCWAPGSVEGTRRDYFIVNDLMYPFVRDFGVCPFGDFPTHAVLNSSCSDPTKHRS